MENRKSYDIGKSRGICLIVLLLCVILAGCGSAATSSDSSSSAVNDGLQRILTTDWNHVPGRYESPVDFPALWLTSPDTIGWLDLSNIRINYPILYREGDREFYLHHDAQGNYAYAGSIYMEDFNRPDFSDPVTVIYGHNMKNNTMFGYLEETYRTEEGFQRGRYFTVYLPEKELHYEVVAAVHYSNRHVLYGRDFTKPGTMEQWMKEVLGTTDGRFNAETSATPEDRLLVLATCTYTKEKRYLVVAKLLEEVSADRRSMVTDCFSKRCIQCEPKPRPAQ